MTSLPDTILNTDYATTKATIFVTGSDDPSIASISANAIAAHDSEEKESLVSAFIENASNYEITANQLKDEICNIKAQYKGKLQSLSSSRRKAAAKIIEYMNQYRQKSWRFQKLGVQITKRAKEPKLPKTIAFEEIHKLLLNINGYDEDASRKIVKELKELRFQTLKKKFDEKKDNAKFDLDLSTLTAKTS